MGPGKGWAREPLPGQKLICISAQPTPSLARPLTGPAGMHINFCPGRGSLVLSMDDYLSQSDELGLKVLTPFPAAASLGLIV